MSEERGFLTRVDRDFLTGEKEYTGENAKQQRYERREAIAARTRQAFRDFALLYDELNEHERDRIFDVGVVEEGDGRIVVDDKAVNDLRDSLIGTFAFLYLSLEGELEPDSAPHLRTLNAGFGDFVDAGVSKAESERRPHPGAYTIDVDFSVDATHRGEVDLERAIDKIAAYRAYELSETELRSIILTYDPATTGDEGDWQDFADSIQQRRDESDAEE